MGSLLLITFLVVVPLMLVSSEVEAASAGNLDLDHVETNFDDKQSLH